MTPFSPIYGQRRRQVILVLLVGAAGLFLASTVVPVLPRYEHSLTAVEGETLHLVAQARRLPRIPDTFFVTHSTDGVTFGEPSTRSGLLAGIAAQDGWLYCLLANGSLVKLSADSWVPLGTRSDWPILGIAAVDGRIKAFGQSKDHTKILTATLDNDTWQPGDALDHEGDNIGFFQGVHADGEDYLVWTENRLDNETFVNRVHLGRLTSGHLEELPSRRFEQRIGMTAVGDADGVHVFFQEVFVLPGRRVRYDPRVQVVSFREGKWHDAHQIRLSRQRQLPMGDFTAASFDGKTYLYGFRYWFGYLYAGLYGGEVHDGELANEFLVLAPQPEDFTLESTWTFATITACFVAGGGLFGLMKLKTFQFQTSPLAEQPIYASVTDRAAAAGLDFTLVYLVTSRITSGAGLFVSCTSFLLAFVLYGTALERWLEGQTLGKKLLGLRVLSTTGAPVDLSTALKRNLFKFIEMVTIGAGVCLASRRFQRPGDLLAATVVVKELYMPRRPREM